MSNKYKFSQSQEVVQAVTLSKEERELIVTVRAMGKDAIKDIQHYISYLKSLGGCGGV